MSAHIEPETIRYRSSKDTRRWCKGKVGTHHVWGIIRRDMGSRFAQLWKGCLTCGRQVDYVARISDGKVFTSVFFPLNPEMRQMLEGYLAKEYV